MSGALLALALTLICVGCIQITPFPSGANRGELKLEVLDEARSLFTTDQVLMIPLEGVVEQRGDGGFFDPPGMLVALKDRLEAVDENPRIRAVVLRIDSPGGGVTAADLIHNEIQRFKARHPTIPVIAQMGDICASGGVYVAMACDEIHALPTTLTGSIGVIMMLPSIEELGNKIGFEMQVVKSGENKDAGSMFDTLTDEEREIFQGLIDDYYSRFTQLIVESRGEKGLTPERLSELADGRVFNAQTALDAGLIDGIVYPELVYRRAMERAGIDDADIVSYEYRGAYRGHILAETPAPRGAGNINLLNIEAGRGPFVPTGPRFHYLWLP